MTNIENIKYEEYWKREGDKSIYQLQMESTDKLKREFGYGNLNNLEIILLAKQKGMNISDHIFNSKDINGILKAAEGNKWWLKHGRQNNPGFLRSALLFIKSKE